MTTVAEELLATVLALPAEERGAYFADELVRSLDAEGDRSVPKWQRDELDRRLEALQRDPSAGSSWSEVQARLVAQK